MPCDVTSRPNGPHNPYRFTLPKHYMLDNSQQFATLLERSHSVLILLPQNPDGDAIGSGWGLYFFLKNRGVDVTIAFSHDPGQLGRYSFLSRPDSISSTITGARDFVLSFNTKYNKINDVRTERATDELRIYITPDKGSIDPRDFSFIPAKFKYDMAVVLDSPDKESLGKLYEENPDIFYELPIINIDHHAGNDSFGQVNIVDMLGSSTAEILADLMEKVDGNSIDENVAECLLTGIIESTNSFQKNNTTPKALHAAAMLMSKGADQQKIVRYLYKTQPLSMIKLWGRIMARLNWEDDLKLAWAPVLIEDFVQSRSNAADVYAVLEKIKDNYSAAKMVMIVFADTPSLARVVVQSADNDVLTHLTTLMGAHISGDTCEFSLEANNVEAAAERTVSRIREMK